MVNARADYESEVNELLNVNGLTGPVAAVFFLGDAISLCAACLVSSHIFCALAEIMLIDNAASGWMKTGRKEKT